MSFNSLEEIHDAGMHVAIIPVMGRALLNDYFKKNNINFIFSTWHSLPDGKYPACVFMGKEYRDTLSCGVISPYTHEEVLKILEVLRYNTPKSSNGNGYSGYSAEEIEKIKGMIAEKFGITISG